MLSLGALKASNLICLGILLLQLLLPACDDSKEQYDINWHEDLSLEVRSNAPVDTSTEQVMDNIVSKSSLPLLIDVQGGKDMFASIPDEARIKHTASIKATLLDCTFTIKTGPIMVDQYIWANRWVKFKMGLDSDYSVVIERNQNGNFAINTDLQIVFDTTPKDVCKKKLRGQKIHMGAFHINDTKLHLIASKDSPKVEFVGRAQNLKAQPLYFNWPRSAAKPQILDQFDVPATLSSPVFQAPFKQTGAYYLIAIPQLSRNSLLSNTIPKSKPSQNMHQEKSPKLPKH